MPDKSCSNCYLKSICAKSTVPCANWLQYP